ncbi:MAG: type I 3-dehydroquinate dehydratase [Candidatus Bathyarchaeia archaeon]
MRPNICVSIMPKTPIEAERLWIESVNSGADYVEVRLDHLNEPIKFEGLQSTPDVVTIATDRTNCKSRGEERFQILLREAEEGFDYIDLDISTRHLSEKMEDLRKYGAKIILSHHDWERTPTVEELENILEIMSMKRADAYKLVTTARNLYDNLLILNFLQQASSRFKIVCFAMGELGKVSRVLSPIFGGLFTIASLKAGDETAPGQISIGDLKTIYEKMSFKTD